MSNTDNQPETTNDNTNEQQVVPEGEFIGYVKWFDDAKGYGYIRIVSNGERYGTDVFVHQTNVCPQRSTYRTLHNSETVSFNLSTDEHPQALDIRGINGRLFCDSVMYRPRGRNYRGNRDDENRDSRGGRGRGSPRGGFRGGRGGGPRSD